MKKIYTIRNGKLVPISAEQLRKKEANKTHEDKFKVRYMADIGMLTVLPLVGGSILGSILDNKLSTKPILTLLFLSLGLFLGFYNMYRLLKDLAR